MSRPPIAVFGSSEPLDGEPLYDSARRTGRLLAEAGWPVISGGYGGVMEAVSRGAVEAGGRAIGVTCSIFAGRSPNRWLSEVHEAADLHERTRRLIEPAAGFVVLGGKAGTLAELALLWALQRAGCLSGRPVLLFRDPWGDLLRHLERTALLEPQQLAATTLVDGPEDAVAALAAAVEE